MQSLLIVLAIGLSGVMMNLNERQRSTYLQNYTHAKDSIQLNAFQVLNTKCNACHLEKKPTYVFTIDNMNTYAKTIHKQVFIKKKMPKGKDFPLSLEDRKYLQNWLITQLPSPDFD